MVCSLPDQRGRGNEKPFVATALRGGSCPLSRKSRQLGGDACFEGVDREGFFQHLVHAEAPGDFKAVHGRDELASARYRNDARLRIDPAHLDDGFDAVFFWHEDIGDHQVELATGETFQRLMAVAGIGDGMAFFHEGSVKHLPVGIIVLDE